MTQVRNRQPLRSPSASRSTKTHQRRFDTIQAKLIRLRQGEAPRVLDLFSGCGGFSLGFTAAGFELAAAIELDVNAARSHGRNFFPGRPEHAQAHDILELEPEDFMASAMPDILPVEAVDVIIGGPPCQAFARVGRAKLRQIAMHPEAYRRDPRAALYLRYVHYVRSLQPLALVMENVIDIMNHGGQNIAQEMAETLEDLGYTVRYTILNAVNYGVPQTRERLFLIGIHRELDVVPGFPAPTHWCDVARGYLGARQVALKHAQLLPAVNFVSPSEAHPELTRAVTASEALRDLPPITLHLDGLLKKGPARYTTLFRYPKRVRPSDYGWLMRNWSGFETTDGIWDHLIRVLPRDYKIFARMQPGDQYPEAHALAGRMLEERLEEERRAGSIIRPGTREYAWLHKQYVPVYDPHKFPNKWRKMEADRPARTLMAHLGKDSYTHIHYDSRQARTISIREAARLQSFPDGFRFEGTMNPAFRQIGNAVPPLLAKAVAETLSGTIRRGLRLLKQKGD